MIFIPNSTIQIARERFHNLFPVPYCLEEGYFEKQINDTVHIHEGDLITDNLNLDYIDESPKLIIVTGSLLVNRLIWNEESDYGIHMIVLGDIRTHNIAVGGQNITIFGNVIVENIVCGNYNHGNMMVKGDIQAKVIVANDYSFECYGEFVGIKMGWSFYSKKYGFLMENDFDEWDLVFKDTVLDEDGFDFEKFLKALLNEENILLESPQEIVDCTDYAYLLKHILSSKILPKTDPYFLKGTNYVMKVYEGFLDLYTPDEITFRYSLQLDELAIEKFESEEIRFKKLEHFPVYLTRKANRFLASAFEDFHLRENKVSNLLTFYPEFLSYFRPFLSENQYKKLWERISLAIQNPVLYTNLYAEDCKNNGIDFHALHLHFVAFSDAMVEYKLGVFVHEKKSLQEGLDVVLDLPLVNQVKYNIEYLNLKWGRKLFAFYPNLLLFNEIMPSGIGFRICAIPHVRKEEILFFLVDDRPKVIEKLNEYLQLFEMNYFQIK